MSACRDSDSSNRHKYCRDSFGNHPVKSKGDLRWVTANQAKNIPQRLLWVKRLVASAERCYQNCQLKRITTKAFLLIWWRLGQEEVMEASETNDNTFISTQSELWTVNQSLEFIGVIPLKGKMLKEQHRMFHVKKTKSTGSYSDNNWMESWRAKFSYQIWFGQDLLLALKDFTLSYYSQ